jgi:hypothetical protein
MAPPSQAFLPAWQFDHMIEHRRMYQALTAPVSNQIAPGKNFRTQPSTNYTGIPYFHDPLSNNTMWHWQHGKSHDDMLQGQPGVWPFGQVGSSAVLPVPNLYDNNLDQTLQFQWWTWANYRSHLSGQSALAPPGLIVFP